MYRVASRIRKALSDAPLTEVWFAFEDLQSWSGRLEGQPLASVETLGKALLLKFPDGTTIYTHTNAIRSIASFSLSLGACGKASARSL